MVSLSLLESCVFLVNKFLFFSEMFGNLVDYFGKLIMGLVELMFDCCVKFFEN